MPQPTIILGSGSRVLLLGVFQLGLIYQLLLLLVLVVLVGSALGGGDAALVREAVEDTDGEGGPSEDLFSLSISCTNSQKVTTEPSTEMYAELAGELASAVSWSSKSNLR